MSIFKFTHPHNTVAAGILLGIILVLTLSPSKEQTVGTSQAEVKMDYKNVQPWLDSIKSLPKDQQRAKLAKAIESQIAVVKHRAERLLDEREASNGSRYDEVKVQIMKDMHATVLSQLFILQDALSAIDK